MTQNTKPIILKEAKKLFAVNGYGGFSMRILSKQSGVGLSSIYHFFDDKDAILKKIFDDTNKQLGIERSKLPKRESGEQMLRDRIQFQFEHIEDVVFVLKYYLHFRPQFLKLDSGYLPTKAYLHIEEVLEVGIEKGEFNIKPNEVDKESKVIAHAINGFLLEYYPEIPKAGELDSVIDSIHQFLVRGLTNKELVMK